MYQSPRRLFIPEKGRRQASAVTIRRLRDVRGLTLLEVMVALAIAAIVLVSVYRLQTQSIAMESIAQFNTIAPLLAEQLVTRVELQAPDFPLSDSGDFEDDFSGYSWEIATQDAGALQTPTGQPLLKQIDVTVYHHENEDRFSMRTYRLATPAQ
jgi:type II secretion system protein I